MHNSQANSPTSNTSSTESPHNSKGYDPSEEKVQKPPKRKGSRGKSRSTLAVTSRSRNLHVRHRHEPVHTWPDLADEKVPVLGDLRFQQWNRAWRGILDQTNFPVRSEKSVLRRWTALRSEREIELP